VPLPPAPESGTGGSGADIQPLYRAVRMGGREMAAIEQTGSFVLGPGQEIRYFATSAEAAARYARMARLTPWGSGFYEFYATSILYHLIEEWMTVPGGVDRGIETIVVPEHLIPRLSRPLRLSVIPLPW
jgi:hypothetical protein